MATISTDSTYSAISGGYSNNVLINIIDGAKLTTTTLIVVAYIHLQGVIHELYL
tara:strand:+ start:453 stop:614 length:162 start_codon:yes stop_codon:yes gene_type:complete